MATTIKWLKIRLKTKISGYNVNSTELECREIVFGNNEKCIFVKDYDGVLRKFGPIEDVAGISSNYTWSSEKIAEAIQEAEFGTNDYIILNTIATPETPSANKLILYMTAVGVSPNREIALKTKLENGDEIIIASSLV